MMMTVITVIITTSIAIVMVSIDRRFESTGRVQGSHQVHAPEAVDRKGGADASRTSPQLASAVGGREART